MGPFAPRLARCTRYLPLLALLPVLWHVLVLARIFATRLGYPMDVEWMEGGELYQAHRWLEGQGIYGPPSQGFIPYGYPPFHFAVLAAGGALFGLDYAMGRGVSILCLVLACAVLFRESWRQFEGEGLAGLALAGLAVGFATAGFPVVGGWYDLVRNDMLAILLPVLAAGLVSGPRLTIRRTLAVSALLVAAVYTKQTGIFFLAWIGLYVLVRDGRRGLVLAGVTALAAGLILGLEQWLTGGWFLTWVTLMARHPLDVTRLRAGALIMLDFAPYLCALPILLAILVFRRWLSARGALWGGMLVVAVPASLLPYIKMGGFLNNVLPVVFLAGSTSLILCGDLVNGLRRSGAPRAARVVLVVTLVGAAGFLLDKRYDPEPYCVTADQQKRAGALNQFVRRLEGGVLIPDFPFLAARNGVTTLQTHTMAHLDAEFAGITRGLLEAISASEAQWLIVNTQVGDPPPPAILQYRFERWIENPVAPLTGNPATLGAVYRRAASD